MSNHEQRDRILRILIETEADDAPLRRSQVIETGPAGTYLLTPSHDPVLVLAAPDDAAQLPAFDTLLGELTDKARGQVLNVLVVGGGGDVAALLKARAPLLQLTRRPRLHHVDSAGAYHALRGARRLRFIARSAERAVAAGDALTPIRPEELEAAQAAGAAATADQRRFGEAIAKSRSPVTVVIAVTLAVLFGLELLFGDGDASTSLFSMGANHGRSVIAGEPWRLFASAFLHGGIPHALINTLSLLAIGPLLEGLLGPWRFSALYLLCALGGSLASAAVHPEVVSIGASGAIWGLMGATAGLVLRPRGLMPDAVAAQMRQRIWGPLAFNLFYSFQGGIDLACHLGGGIAGFLLVAGGIVTVGLSPVTESASTRRYEAPFRFAAVLLWTSALASIVMAQVSGRPWEINRPGELQRVVLPNGPVSLLLPPRLKARPGGEEKTIAFGEANRDPILLVVGVFGPMAEDERSGFTMAGLRDKVAEVASEAGVSAKPPVIEKVGEREMVTQVHEFKNGVQDKAWFVLVGDRLVRINAFTTGTTPPRWRAMIPQIVESVASAN